MIFGIILQPPSWCIFLHWCAADLPTCHHRIHGFGLQIIARHFFRWHRGEHRQYSGRYSGKKAPAAADITATCAQLDQNVCAAFQSSLLDVFWVAQRKFPAYAAYGRFYEKLFRELSVGAFGRHFDDLAHGHSDSDLDILMIW